MLHVNSKTEMRGKLPKGEWSHVSPACWQTWHRVMCALTVMRCLASSFHYFRWLRGSCCWHLPGPGSWAVPGFPSVFTWAVCLVLCGACWRTRAEQEWVEEPFSSLPWILGAPIIPHTLYLVHSVFVSICPSVLESVQSALTVPAFTDAFLIKLYNTNIWIF